LTDPSTHDDRAAGVDHNHRIFICFCYGFDQVVLTGGQIERLKVEVFRLDGCRSSHDDYSNIRRRRDTRSLLDELFPCFGGIFGSVLAFHRNALGVSHLNALTSAILNAFERRYRVFWND
jgi:hypothetical protein